MLPTSLSNVDLRRFNLQISDDTIGIDGQEKLRYSQVVVQGLEGIGIATMRCLLASGIGEVIVIDDGVITEKMLPSQTLFGISDVGKLRCIAAREKLIGGMFGNSLQLYNTKLSEGNMDRLLGNAKVLVKTTWGPKFHHDMLDIMDKRDLTMVGGFGVGWKGVFGTYSGNNKDGFRELFTNIYLRNIDIFSEEHICFSHVSNVIGGALASITIKTLLNMDNVIPDSDFYQVDLLNLNFEKCL